MWKQTLSRDPEPSYQFCLRFSNVFWIARSFRSSVAHDDSAAAAAATTTPTGWWHGSSCRTTRAVPRAPWWTGLCLLHAHRHVWLWSVMPVQSPAEPQTGEEGHLITSPFFVLLEMQASITLMGSQTSFAWFGISLLLSKMCWYSWNGICLDCDALWCVAGNEDDGNLIHNSAASFVRTHWLNAAELY